jgi:hypothetical protein
LLDALAETGFERLGKELKAAMAGIGPGFVEELTVFAQTYVRFASCHPALLDLMFAGRHRPGADPRLRRADNRAFRTPLELITSRMIGKRPVDAVIADTIGVLIYGLEARPV